MSTTPSKVLFVAYTHASAWLHALRRPKVFSHLKLSMSANAVFLKKLVKDATQHSMFLFAQVARVVSTFASTLASTVASFTVVNNDITVAGALATVSDGASASAVLINDTQMINATPTEKEFVEGKPINADDMVAFKAAEAELLSRLQPAEKTEITEAAAAVFTEAIQAADFGGWNDMVLYYI